MRKCVSGGMHRPVGEQCRNQHQHGVAEVHGGLFPKYQLFLLLSPSGVCYILQYYWFDVHFVRFYCSQITMPYIVPIDVPRRPYFSHCKLVEAVSMNSLYATLSN